MIESDDSQQEQMNKLQVFETVICQLMFAIHEQKAPDQDTDAAKVAKFCIGVSKESVYESVGSIKELVTSVSPKKSNG